MNCKFCGAELVEGKPFCPSCGKNNTVEETVVEEAVAEETAVEETAAAEENTAAENTAEEVSKEADDLSVDPVDDVIKHSTGYKIPNEQLMVSPRF